MVLGGPRTSATSPGPLEGYGERLKGWWAWGQCFFWGDGRLVGWAKVGKWLICWEFKRGGRQK